MSTRWRLWLLLEVDLGVLGRLCARFSLAGFVGCCLSKIKVAWIFIHDSTGAFYLSLEIQKYNTYNESHRLRFETYNICMCVFMGSLS